MSVFCSLPVICLHLRVRAINSLLHLILVLLSGGGLVDFTFSDKRSYKCVSSFYFWEFLYPVFVESIRGPLLNLKMLVRPFGSRNRRIHNFTSSLRWGFMYGCLYVHVHVVFFHVITTTVVLSIIGFGHLLGLQIDVTNVNLSYKFSILIIFFFFFPSFVYGF